MLGFKLLGVVGIASTIHQALIAGIKFVNARGKKEATYNIGEYVVTVKTNPATMGCNVVAQTCSLVGIHASVTVDGLFWLLNKDDQESILAHELGHMVLKGGMPKDMVKYTMSRQVGICPPEEKVADSYSAMLYGSKATKKTLAKLLLIAPSPEIIQRIVAVGKD